MKKILVSLICCLTATLGWAQEKNAYTLFDAQGNRVDYTQMMDVLERQDVVFIGEIHNCPIAHWMEYEIVKDLYDRHGDRLMIGAEMFERDNQLILDEYLAGMITPERLHATPKPSSGPTTRPTTLRSSNSPKSTRFPSSPRT